MSISRKLSPPTHSCSRHRKRTLSSCATNHAVSSVSRRPAATVDILHIHRRLSSKISRFPAFPLSSAACAALFLIDTSNHLRYTPFHDSPTLLVSPIRHTLRRCAASLAPKSPFYIQTPSCGYNTDTPTFNCATRRVKRTKSCTEVNVATMIGALHILLMSAVTRRFQPQDILCPVQSHNHDSLLRHSVDACHPISSIFHTAPFFPFNSHKLSTPHAFTHPVRHHPQLRTMIQQPHVCVPDDCARTRRRQAITIKRPPRTRRTYGHPRIVSPAVPFLPPVYLFIDDDDSLLRHYVNAHGYPPLAIRPLSPAPRTSLYPLRLYDPSTLHAFKHPFALTHHCAP
ncbi:hypothetical protein HYPSUDRAFT_204065 [Hypholoma sublateritium FD-334 SS-4]|uniref:Uncharacterized protein n=1 Tax=Hypholoma sublateritium (strain FD-334 SS-4) TaxID=945553 RepID=A0A0D2PJ22_HYPSF|nr:hypothetical protein HYPSUDRAFT_204065 [Hypholoma sublateritium FD-334 SS-4]